MPSLRMFVVLVSMLVIPVPSLTAAQKPTQPPGESGPVPEDAPRPASSKSSNQNVRVDVTIALEADGKPLSKTLSMVTGDGKSALGRAGIEIPVRNQGPMSPSFNYRNVSVNVDAIPQILDANRVMLRLKLNFSTVYKPESGDGTLPSFGNGSHDAFGIVFESGKPVVVTQATDGETGRAYRVEVKATILK